MKILRNQEKEGERMTDEQYEELMDMLRQILRCLERIED